VNKQTSSGAIPLILSGTNVEETPRETSERSEIRQAFVVRKRTGHTTSPVRHPTLLPPSASTGAESEQPTCDTRDVMPRPHAEASSRQHSPLSPSMKQRQMAVLTILRRRSSCPSGSQ